MLSPHRKIKKMVGQDEQFDFALTITNDRVAFIKAEKPASFVKTTDLINCESKEVTGVIGAVDSMVKSTTKRYDMVSMYFLYDFSSSLVPVGVIGYEGTGVCVLDHNDSDVQYLTDLVVRQVKAATQSAQGKIIKAIMKHEPTSITIGFGDRLDYLEVRLLRASGINLGLIMIQDLYRRKIRTYRFVTTRIHDKNEFPTLELDASKVYYDLDETLVWEGKPLGQGIKYLRQFVDTGFKVSLLTRHKYDIYQTLSQIEVDPLIFTEIIKVQAEEKKSSYIREHSLFIDNEFPERVDAYKNASAVCLGVDQLEFLDL